MKKVRFGKPVSTVSTVSSFNLLSVAVVSVSLFSSPASAQIKPVKNVDPAPVTLKVQAVAQSLQAPTAMVFPGNGEAWITEQTGKIRVIKNGTLAEEPLMDLKSKLTKINNGYEERGLLGIALHPQFATTKNSTLFTARLPLLPRKNQIIPRSWPNT